MLFVAKRRNVDLSGTKHHDVGNWELRNPDRRDVEVERGYVGVARRDAPQRWNIPVRSAAIRRVSCAARGAIMLDLGGTMRRDV